MDGNKKPTKGLFKCALDARVGLLLLAKSCHMSTIFQRARKTKRNSNFLPTIRGSTRSTRRLTKLVVFFYFFGKFQSQNICCAQLASCQVQPSPAAISCSLTRYLKCAACPPLNKHAHKLQLLLVATHCQTLIQSLGHQRLQGLPKNRTRDRSIVRSNDPMNPCPQPCLA